MVKCYSSSQKTLRRDTKRHPPYEITHCYLPPDTGKCPASTQAR